MKRKLPLTLLLFLFIQSFLIAEKAPGYIIFVNGDSASVTVHIPVLRSGHLHPLKFQNDPSLLVNGKKQKLNLGQILEVGFDFKNLHFVFRKIVFFNGGKPAIKLKHLVSDGYIQIYNNYFKPRFKGQEAIASEFFLVNENRESYFPRLMAFRKNIRKFLRGCPKFDATVDGKKFKRKEIPALMMAYNDRWADR